MDNEKKEVKNEASPPLKSGANTGSNENDETNEEEENIKEIPQDSELIEKIVEDAILNKNKENCINSDAKTIEFDISLNDPCLMQTVKDGACMLYSYVYVVFRTPILKQMLLKKIRKDENNYYIMTTVENEKYTFKIPISTIEEEKEHNRGNLFSSDKELINALGVYLHALLFLKCSFIDRLAFQPFFSTDAFFDQQIKNIGFGFSLFLPENSVPYLKSDNNQVTLNDDGSLFLCESNEQLNGFYFIVISLFPIKFKFGHCFFVFFNIEEKQWKIYNCCPYKDFGEYGEFGLNQIKQTNFNGSCIICGIPQEVLEEESS